MLTLLLTGSLFYWNEFADIHSAYGPKDWVNYGHGAVPVEIEKPKKHSFPVYRPKKHKIVEIDDLNELDEMDSSNEPDSSFELED